MLPFRKEVPKSTVPVQNKTDLPIFQKGADAHPEGPENEPCTEIIIIPQTVQNSGLFSLATGLNYKYH